MKSAAKQTTLARSYKKFIGKFPSYRLNAIVNYESLLERDFLYLLEFDHRDVVSFQARPYQISYMTGTKCLRFTPAFSVVRQYKKQLVEITSAPRAAQECNQFRYRIVAQLCENEGYEFVVITDAMIRQPPRLNNIKLLIRYQRTQINPQHQIMCHELFSVQPKISLNNVFDYFADRSVDKQVVYALIRWGIIDIDLARPIASNSSVRLPIASLVERKAS